MRIILSNFSIRDTQGFKVRNP